jgi:uncharacterized protein YbjQ (UPF0145 family)
MSSIIHTQAADIPYNMTSTGFDIPGFRIVASLGVVRGVVVRSRSVVGTIGAGLQTLLGGNISLFTELAERTRKQAFDTMLVQADMAGADAVIGIRYDANELMKGVTEVLCYGTAVQLKPLDGHVS